MLVSFSPATGHTLPDRYIEGTCPICGYPEARGDQCDNCGNQLDPTDLINPRSRIDGSTPEFRETKHLFLDLPQFADRLRDVDRRARRLAAERPELLARAARRDPAAADHARPRLGRPHPGAGLRRGREQAHLRLVRRGDRLPLGVDRVGGASGDPDAWREWWQNPEAEHYYFQGKDNIVFHTVIWPAMLLGYGEGGEYGAGRGAARAARQRRRDRVPDHGGQAVLAEPRPLDLRARLPRPLRRRRAPLLPRRGQPGDAGHRLHLGRVRPPQQRRAARELGQPRQPDAHERPPQLRRRPRAGRADRGATARSSRSIDGGFDEVGVADRARRASGARSARRCGSRPRSTSTSATRRRGRS